jgi:hypothetical protein
MLKPSFGWRLRNKGLRVRQTAKCHHTKKKIGAGLQGGWIVLLLFYHIVIIL